MFGVKLGPLWISLPNLGIFTKTNIFDFGAFYDPEEGDDVKHFWRKNRFSQKIKKSKGVCFDA